jgi:hypothetical protein
MNIITGNLVKNIIISPVVGTIGYQLSWEFIKTLVHTITSTTQEIVGFVTLIEKNIHHTNICLLFNELDLCSEITFLQTISKEINVEKNNTQSLAISLKFLQFCLNDIHDLLHEIKSRIEHNKKLWITAYGLREYKFDDLYKKLEVLSKKLQKRKENFKTALNMKEYLIPMCLDNISIDVIDNDTSFGNLLIT